MCIFTMLYKLILLVLALGLEIYILECILNESISEQNLISILLSHFIASAISAYIFLGIFVPNYNETRLRNCIFFFVIIFYLPVLGLLGLISAIPFVIFHSPKLEKLNLYMNTYKIRDLPITETAVTDSQPVMLHNLIGLYRSKNYHRRLQAVYATLKLKDEDAIPLLHKALGDPIDDIRLLAYALLDRKENFLSKRINKNKQKLEQIEHSRNKKLCLLIANDYWELVRLGLIQGEAQNYILNMACKYIELGLEHYPQDLGLCFLHAQVLLKLRNYPQAYAQFKKTENLGMDRRNLLVYYAEIAFYSRQYLEVKELMKTVDLPTAHPKLSAVTEFWQKAS